MKFSRHDFLEISKSKTPQKTIFFKPQYHNTFIPLFPDETFPQSSQSERQESTTHVLRKSMEESDFKKARKYTTVKEKIATLEEVPTIELSDKDKELLRKLELEHEAKIKSEPVKQKSATIDPTPLEKMETGTKPSVKPRLKVKISYFHGQFFILYLNLNLCVIFLAFTSCKRAQSAFFEGWQSCKFRRSWSGTWHWSVGRVHSADFSYQRHFCWSISR